MGEPSNAAATRAAHHQDVLQSHAASSGHACVLPESQDNGLCSCSRGSKAKIAAAQAAGSVHAARQGGLSHTGTIMHATPMPMPSSVQLATSMPTTEAAIMPTQHCRGQAANCARLPGREGTHTWALSCMRCPCRCPATHGQRRACRCPQRLPSRLRPPQRRCRPRTAAAAGHAGLKRTLSARQAGRCSMQDCRQGARHADRHNDRHADRRADRHNREYSNRHSAPCGRSCGRRRRPRRW